MENLRLIQLSIEIHSTNNTKNAIYRLYVNNDMLTERTWIWDDKTFITEQISVLLPIGVHVLKLEQINCNDFSLHNLKVNSHIEHFNQNSKEIKFAVDASSPKVG